MLKVHQKNQFISITTLILYTKIYIFLSVLFIFFLKTTVVILNKNTPFLWNTKPFEKLRQLFINYNATTNKQTNKLKRFELLTKYLVFKI